SCANPATEVNANTKTTTHNRIAASYTLAPSSLFCSRILRLLRPFLPASSFVGHGSHLDDLLALRGFPGAGRSSIVMGIVNRLRHRAHIARCFIFCLNGMAEDSAVVFRGQALLCLSQMLYLR